MRRFERTASIADVSNLPAQRGQAQRHEYSNFDSDAKPQLRLGVMLL
jgi:hypothetical protein